MFVFFLILMLANPCWAKDYTITLSENEESALASAIQRSNEPLTHQQHLQDRITGLLRSYAVQQREEQTQQLKSKYDAASPAQRQQIDTILNSLSGSARKQ